MFAERMHELVSEIKIMSPSVAKSTVIGKILSCFIAKM